MIAVNDLSMRFGGIVAIDHCSLTVEKGTITGLIGPNGAGKTTLFNIIAGLFRPSEGRVLLDGTDVTGWPAHRLFHRGLVRTFQIPREHRQAALEEFRYHLTEPTQWHCEIDSLERRDWFSVGLGVEVDGMRLDLLPILLDALRQLPRGLLEEGDVSAKQLVVPLDNEAGETRLLRLPMQRLIPLLHTVLELYDESSLDQVDRLHFSRVQLARLSGLDTMDGQDRQARRHWQGDEDARQLIERLRDLQGIAEVAAPAGLTVQLRPYQQQGLSWLQFLREYRLAGILADDMGLGKTLQALAHLLAEKEAGRADRPSLVVAEHDLVITTYPLSSITIPGGIPRWSVRPPTGPIASGNGRQ